jgi:probable rRNA maturation factor
VVQFGRFTAISAMPHAAPSPIRFVSVGIGASATDTAAVADDPPQAGVQIDVRPMPRLGRKIDIQRIKTNLRHAAAALIKTGETEIARISVLIVNDARMIELHRQHVGNSSTTDVLTFDLREKPGQPVEADLVLCADEAARRADEHGHSIERELLLYALHGLLHCVGYDDHDDAGWRRMHAREDELLTAIGVGATFRRDSERGQPPC